MTKQTPEERYTLIARNTQEILGEKELKEKLAKGENLKIYIGTATTGSPHVAYFSWAMKLVDFIRAGCEVTVLLADVHGALDNTPWEILDKRYAYYEAIVPAMLASLGLKKGHVNFVKGSDYQLKEDYQMDLLKLSTIVSVHDAQKSGSEVVKQETSPKLSGLLYPLMQILDEEYLKCDVQFGGVDQRKIFVLAMESIEKLGYKKRSHIMTPILPGLIGKKMSSSTTAGKVDLIDSPEIVTKKIKGAAMEIGNADNAILNFMEHVIFPVKGEKGENFVITRDEKYGGNLEYPTFKELEEDFSREKLHPMDMKSAFTDEINKLLAPIQKDKKIFELHKAAYE